jgi:GTP-binding protein
MWTRGSLPDLPGIIKRSVGVQSFVKTPSFIDTAVLYISGGDGGNGCVSFRREKFVPHGGPDGGDGGRGGHVTLKADIDQNSLLPIFYAPHRKADSGKHGQGKRIHGRNGTDMTITIPCGTEVYDKDAGVLIKDMIENGSELIVAHGGKGGKGNWHWKSSTHQAPTEHTDGEPGIAINLKLELKLVSDAGLVGFPNAGKSSLLARISDAHPKIGQYPFTTLNPVVGTLVFEDYTRLKIADIPGLITDAHKGVGLGHAFLRHVERARYLVFVIDMAASDGREPFADFLDLKKELELYRPGLEKRPSLYVANKMDLPEASQNLDEFERETGVRPIAVSATEGLGIDELQNALHALEKKYGSHSSENSGFTPLPNQV